MALSFINFASGFAAGPTITTVDCDADGPRGDGELDVLAGDVLVAVLSWQNALSGDTVEVADTDGSTNSMTFPSGGSAVEASDVGGATLYKLDATADSGSVFRFTVSANSRRMVIAVLQFRPTGGQTESLDGTPIASSGSSAALDSGNITTSGADTVIVGGGSSADTIFATERIGTDDANDLDPAAGEYLQGWYIIYASDPQTNVSANCTVTDDNWVGTVLGIKSVAGAAAPGALFKKPFDNYIRNLITR